MELFENSFPPESEAFRRLCVTRRNRTDKVRTMFEACESLFAEGGRALAFGGRLAQSRGHSHQVGKRPRSYLFHHPAPVSLNCDLADTEFGTDLLVQLAADDQTHDTVSIGRMGRR
jgi:hypothetical protein